MVSGDTRAQTSAPPVEASPAPPEQPAPGTLGRNREGYRWIRRTQEAFTESALQERLLGGIRSWRDYPPSLRLWFWLIPVITAAIGEVLRFVRLDTAHSLGFDSNHYVKDWYSLLVRDMSDTCPDLVPGAGARTAAGSAVAPTFRALPRGTVCAGAVLLSAFFYPVWTGEIIPYQDWRFRMWTPY